MARSRPRRLQITCGAVTRFSRQKWRVTVGLGHASPVVGKDNGALTAFDVATGEPFWRSDGRLGDNVSLTVQEKSGDTLKELARYKMSDSPIWASPALAGNRLLIKDEPKLTLFTLATSQSSRSPASLALLPPCPSLAAPS